MAKPKYIKLDSGELRCSSSLICGVCKGHRTVRELICVTGEPELDRVASVTCRACGGNGLNISTVELLELCGCVNVVKVR